MKHGEVSSDTKYNLNVKPLVYKKELVTYGFIPSVTKILVQQLHECATSLKVNYFN